MISRHLCPRRPLGPESCKASRKSEEGACHSGLTGKQSQEAGRQLRDQGPHMGQGWGADPGLVPAARRRPASLAHARPAAASPRSSLWGGWRSSPARPLPGPSGAETFCCCFGCLPIQFGPGPPRGRRRHCSLVVSRMQHRHAAVMGGQQEDLEVPCAPVIPLASCPLRAEDALKAQLQLGARPQQLCAALLHVRGVGVSRAPQPKPETASVPHVCWAALLGTGRTFPPCTLLNTHATTPSASAPG